MDLKTVLLVSLLLRIGFFLFGLFQDAFMQLPYTDIDYFVFTDASKLVSLGLSPFERSTYRYTPLLSWIMVPTSYKYFFSFGKIVFIICDLITGYIILKSVNYNYLLSLIWLFNPMVITISTRGSSESLLTCFILLSIYALNKSKIIISGLLMGLSIHLKIYPFIYIPTILLYIDSDQPLIKPFTVNRLKFIISTFSSFTILTFIMFKIYGIEYINESFIYHLTRIDHRHNFSIYNLTLYVNSFIDSNQSQYSIEKMAFLPQLLLTLFIIPLSFKPLFSTNSTNNNLKFQYLNKILFIQTITFITFNKVCTSQYFIWFLCLLPQFLQNSTISLQKYIVLLSGWVLTQSLWLYTGWLIEFKGDYQFTSMFISSILFFAWNIILICCFITDLQQQYSLNVKKDK